jgi:hypothetical protein
MKKLCLIVVLLFFISLVLLGCQPNTDNENSNNQITKVSISNSKGFGEVSTDFIIVFEDEETLETFQNTITKAKKREGIVDMIYPKFDLEVIYKDGTKKEYHLWVGEKGGNSSLMNVDNTHAVYSISEEFTNQLISLIK